MSGQPLLGVTPTQTVGPFFSPALLRDVLNVLTTDSTAGQRIRIEGRVFDGAGNVVPDALIEIWQANSHGRFNHPRDQRVGDGLAVAIVDDALNADALTVGRIGDEHLPLGIGAQHRGREERSDGLRRRQPERTHRAASNGVAAVPRSTMSQR